MIIKLYCLLNKENEPGVDNLLIDTPKKRWETLKNLNLPDYKAKPLKRIYIPKKNGKKRPLGIPTCMTGWNKPLIYWGLIRYLNLRLIIIPMDSGKTSDKAFEIHH